MLPILMSIISLNKNKRESKVAAREFVVRAINVDLAEIKGSHAILSCENLST